jgi:hypothetical protein
MRRAPGEAHAVCAHCACRSEPVSVPPSLSLSLCVVASSLVAHFKFLQDNTLADAPVAELLQSLQVGTLPPCPTHANPI